jgi:nucleoside 2-deoxyribosyltransferase
MPAKTVRPTRSGRHKVYLAGPEVFLRNALEAGAAKVEICARHGMEGKYPLDAQLDLGELALAERAYTIAGANEGLIGSCDAVIANLTPFRGPGADTGTAYEVGYARGRGMPVFGYSNHHLLFFDRVRKSNTKPLKHRPDSEPTMAFEDRDKMGVEQFGLAENLMVIGAIQASGGGIVIGRTKRRNRYTDLTAFEDCVKQVAALLLRK